MRRSARAGVRGVFGVLVVAGLGFGGAQAFAAPAAAAATAGTCLKEDAAACNANCRETYGNNYVGVCYADSWGNVSCGCRKLTLP